MPMRLFCVALPLVGLLFASPQAAEASDVVGRIEMPAGCSTIASPAVVTLEPVDRRQQLPPVDASRLAEIALVHQQGLQFEPRVQVVTVGQTIRFTNEDAEPHNVHIVTPGVLFNQMTAPGKPAEFKTDTPGVLRLACDIHSHMRGFVVVSATPWTSIVRNGRFRLDNVVPGTYKLFVWHELGEPHVQKITVGSDRLDLGTITLKGYENLAATSAAAAPVRPWSEVIDRISVKLAEARALATQKGAAPKARKLAEDAYWDEFESSDMETAIRTRLGFQRAGDIEGHFRDFRFAIRDLSQSKISNEKVVQQSRDLLMALYDAAGELNRAGITDRSKLSATAGAPSNTEPATSGIADLPAKKRALSVAFNRIQSFADANDPSEAASAMTTAYFDAFEPLERMLSATKPQAVRPLEVRFNALRGEIAGGLKGDTLAQSLDGLFTDVSATLDQANSTSGTFASAFLASLVTIVREGVEVILILTMLVALVVKTGRSSALPAIRWGVFLAFVASILTAIGLNLLVTSSQGRARELMEGWVLMVASGVLFYVSYWLISQSEAKRWTDYLKRHAAEGAKAGALGTLGLTAFLAVYREGAETALMYQALLSGQKGSPLGLAGLFGGLAVGLVVLAAFYVVLKTTSIRLPIQTFFKVTGSILFAMAVIFAGHGVFELQQAGILRVTEVRWMHGTGLAWLGIYPNVQALSVQSLILGGALLSLLFPWFESGAKGSSTPVAPGAAQASA